MCNVLMSKYSIIQITMNYSIHAFELFILFGNWENISHAAQFTSALHYVKWGQAL